MLIQHITITYKPLNNFSHSRKRVCYTHSVYQIFMQSIQTVEWVFTLLHYKCFTNQLHKIPIWPIKLTLNEMYLVLRKYDPSAKILGVKLRSFENLRDESPLLPHVKWNLWQSLDFFNNSSYVIKAYFISLFIILWLSCKRWNLVNTCQVGLIW